MQITQLIYVCKLALYHKNIFQIHYQEIVSNGALKVISFS